MEYVDEITLADDDDPLKYGRPSGIAVTDFGEVWMSDVEANRVAVFDNVGQFSRFVGDYGYDGGELLKPQKIDLSKEQLFYVCDAGNRRVAVYDEYGNFEREIYDEALESPQAVATQGRLVWILDSGRNLVHCFDRAGTLLLTAGPLLTGTDRGLSGPMDIAVHPDGRLIISDTGNNRILVCRVITDTE